MSCIRCGECCDHMVISFHKDEHWEGEREWLLVHSGVSIESEDSDKEALIRLELPCQHLVRAVDGKPAECRVHDCKPRICREYPDRDNLDYLEKHPQLTPRCGYLSSNT